MIVNAIIAQLQVYQFCVWLLETDNVTLYCQILLFKLDNVLSTAKESNITLVKDGTQRTRFNKINAKVHTGTLLFTVTLTHHAYYVKDSENSVEVG